MKNRKGQTIPQPYLDLAMMRREQQEVSQYRKDCDSHFSRTNELFQGFEWQITPEKGDWWADVNEGNSPEIPASSLAELEAWRKAKLIDYKTMYEDLLDKLEFYKKPLKGLKQLLSKTYLPPNSNPPSATTCGRLHLLFMPLIE